MRDRDSAFAILGLRPGAGRAEIDQAYKRLIKRHHPDHAGGDSARAAEINQAYAQLRRPDPPPPPRPGRPLPPARRPRRWGGALALMALVGAMFLLARIESAPSDRSWPTFSERAVPAPADRRAPRRLPTSRAFDEPLANALIDRSVNDALRLHGIGDTGLMAEFSRTCLTQLRDNPSSHRFDACAAYDEAVAILQSADSGSNSGAFNPSAVTARQVGAARLLSSDPLLAESRLRQVRSRVHLTLLPRIPDDSRAVDAETVGTSATAHHALPPDIPEVLLPPPAEWADGS